MTDDEKFQHLLAALAPWRDRLVVIGGWAHRLYRRSALATSPAHAALTTRDADMAFDGVKPLDGSIRDALLAAGFTENLSSEFRPPITTYAYGGDADGFYVEFVTPQRGSGVKRSGDPDATMRAAGITAQKLSHLDILMIEPWRVASRPGSEHDVAVANPVSFIAQKALIARQRRTGKKSQDLLYVHDTLELFTDRLPELALLWRNRVAPSLSQRDGVVVVEGLREMFDSITDTLRDAARIDPDRGMSPERMRTFCAAAIATVFSAD